MILRMRVKFRRIMSVPVGTAGNVSGYLEGLDFVLAAEYELGLLPLYVVLL